MKVLKKNSDLNTPWNLMMNSFSVFKIFTALVPCKAILVGTRKF